MAWNEPGDNKDPWGGKKKSNDSPPELDEVVKNLQRKLKKAFGGGGNSGPSSSSPRGDSGGKGSMALPVVVILFLLIAWAAFGIFIVAPAEQSVVLRFGKYHDTVGPGPHWIPPFIDSERKLNVEKVSTYTYSAEMLTKDENIVSVSLAVQYRVGNAKDYFYNVTDPSASLRQATASALRQVIGHTTLDEILTTGRETVRSQTAAQITKILAKYQAGLVLVDVAMQPAKAPEEVKPAFDDAIKAQEDQQTYVNQAQAYAAGVIPVAEGQAQRILADARAYKQQVVLNAQAVIAPYVAIESVYAKAPAITRERMYLETMQSVLEHSSKVLVDLPGKNSMFYLPLDKILDKAGSPASAKLTQQAISSLQQSATDEQSNAPSIDLSASTASNSSYPSYPSRADFTRGGR